MYTCDVQDVVEKLVFRLALTGAPSMCMYLQVFVDFFLAELIPEMDSSLGSYIKETGEAKKRCLRVGIWPKEYKLGNQASGPQFCLRSGPRGRQKRSAARRSREIEHTRDPPHPLPPRNSGVLRSLAGGSTPNAAQHSSSSTNSTVTRCHSSVSYFQAEKLPAPSHAAGAATARRSWLRTGSKA